MVVKCKGILFCFRDKSGHIFHYSSDNEGVCGSVSKTLAAFLLIIDKLILWRKKLERVTSLFLLFKTETHRRDCQKISTPLEWEKRHRYYKKIYLFQMLFVL